jgi:hypothetical protein
VRRQDIPEPQAIDPASGFKVPHRNLVKQWDGEYVDQRFVDKRNPQDLIRVRADTSALVNPQPEPADVFLASNIVLEDGVTPMVGADGVALMTEGLLGGAGL